MNNSKPIEGTTVINGEVKTQEKRELVSRPAESAALPSFPTKTQIEEYKAFLQNYDDFINTQLKDAVDFGTIPGVKKPSLFKPGAEKLEKLFFLTHEKQLIEKIVEPQFIKYTYRTIIYDKAGRIKATCEGTCNSKEDKYRYTTVNEKEVTEEQKKKAQRIVKSGKYGEYATYRIERNDVYNQENTIMKMAQKRSYVGAILEATNSSGRFTQDVEEMDIKETAQAPRQPAPAYQPRVATPARTAAQPTQTYSRQVPLDHQCAECPTKITKKVADYSVRNFGIALCFKHQKEHDKIQ